MLRKEQTIVDNNQTGMKNPLSLKALNHISVGCRSVQDSIHFYQNVLGFIPIKRPGSFNFEGAWLFNYGIGIHLIQSEELNHRLPRVITRINPKDNHISFMCESMTTVETKLKEMKIEFVRGRVEEGGLVVDQLFFHDPDGSMIEICNCETLPIVPLTGPCSLLNSNSMHHPIEYQPLSS